MSDRALPRLLASARRHLAEDRELALATIVATEGSTYRKAGARMLIAPDGVLDGVLGGGCFDTDLAEQARRTIAAGRCRTVEYDMRSPDDAIWGLGLGCEGLVRVFIQPLARDAAILRQLDTLAARDEGGLLATLVGPDGHPRQGQSWVLGEDPLPEEFGSGALGSAAGPRLETVGSGLTLFLEPVRPAPVLVVCGAGVDALPVVTLAAGIGWRTVVLDHRPGHVRPDRFPENTTVLSVDDGAGELDRAAAALVMSHSIDGDLRYLRLLARRATSWVGVLGPTARRQRLLELLAEDAGDLPARLRGPVGLDLGGELPEEVALSIVAELQTHYYGADAAALTGSGRK